MTTIPHNRPSVAAEDIEAVGEALRSGWLAQGPRVQTFEEAVSTYVGGGEAVAVSSGTAALYLTLLALGAGPGGEVIVPTYSCSALLNAVHLAGATPVVADVLRDTYALDPADAARRITARTQAVIAVHVYGVPAPMADLLAIGVPIIEDCAQALGSRQQGVHVGRAGRAAVYSFYATKLITMGYGGMVVSADADLVDRIRDYREFDRRPTYAPRFNFQLSDVQAALGISQLRRLDAMVQRRAAIQAAYRRALRPGIGMQSAGAEAEPNGFRFVLEFPTVETRDAAQSAFQAAGIETIIPVERYELLHRYLHRPSAEYEAAEAVVDHTLSVPTFPTMTDEQVARVCSVLGRLG